jgi:1-acyl-sn-glycerol-3-phosphate acyltransferase
MPAPPSAHSDPNIETGGDSEAGRRADRLDEQAPPQPMRRYRLARFAASIVPWLYSGWRIEGRSNLPDGPAVLCFNHQNWIDPLFALSALPARPRCHFFGPEQEDMKRGFRNRVMRWSGVSVPYQPGRRGLVAATRRAESLLAAGAWIGIFGEGRIHSGESVVLPLLEGPAYMALRSGVPLVPVAINGTSWLAFRRRVRVRVGQPIQADPSPQARPEPAAVAALTVRAQEDLARLVSDFPDPPRSRWLGAWLTELFNSWPEGSRPPIPGGGDVSGRLLGGPPRS